MRLMPKSNKYLPIFDVYEFVCNLIKRASSRIILIDNYVDESVLTMLDKRRTGIPATISVFPSLAAQRGVR